MGDTDTNQDDREPTPVLRESVAADDDDLLAGVKSMPIVGHMHTKLVAVQVEPPKPVQKPNGRVNVILKPFVSPARPPGMATMSDLGKAGTSSATPVVARPARRPPPPKPTEEPRQ
jgi:hypothetical protein